MSPVYPKLGDCSKRHKAEPEPLCHTAQSQAGQKGFMCPLRPCACCQRPWGASPHSDPCLSAAPTDQQCWAQGHPVLKGIVFACHSEQGEEPSSLLLGETCSHLKGLCSQEPAEPQEWDTRLRQLRYLQGLWAGLWLLLYAAWRVHLGCGSGACCWDRRLLWLFPKNAPKGLIWVAFLSALLLAV